MDLPYCRILFSSFASNKKNSPFENKVDKKLFSSLLCPIFSPVPSYNWTRDGASLPRGAVFSNYNRVLTIPRVQVEDQGDYICHVHNDKASMSKKVTLTIQGMAINHLVCYNII